MTANDRDLALLFERTAHAKSSDANKKFFNDIIQQLTDAGCPNAQQLTAAHSLSMGIGALEAAEDRAGYTETAVNLATFFYDEHLPANVRLYQYAFMIAEGASYLADEKLEHCSLEAISYFIDNAERHIAAPKEKLHSPELHLDVPLLQARLEDVVKALKAGPVIKIRDPQTRILLAAAERASTPTLQ